MISSRGLARKLRQRARNKRPVLPSVDLNAIGHPNECLCQCCGEIRKKPWTLTPGFCLLVFGVVGLGASVLAMIAVINSVCP